ncbi:MAG: hypothetical protein JWQ03_1002 [Variovorax sp.]|nr:hypothetical protein [Variovorax sp.]
MAAAKPALALIASTNENRLMDRLLTEWAAQLEQLKAPSAALDVVRSYHAAVVPDKHYAVHVLCRSGSAARGAGSPFEGFVHINHAHPHSKRPVLRLVWNRFAPKYDAAEDPAKEHARLFTTVLAQALTMSRNSHRSNEVKIFLCNAADHTHARSFAGQLTGVPGMPFKTSVRGSWLHLEWLKEGKHD